MYIPRHFSVDPADVRTLLGQPGAAQLITPTAAGLLATFLPFVFDPSIGEHGALLCHVARNNPQWSEPALGESLAIIQESDAYISPSWYAEKAKHGRVVPTWNYSTIHVHGRLVIHDDPHWLGRQVRALTDLNEADMPCPWSVDDAPERFVAGQLRAIVGIELIIERIEAKAKLSQNRPATDIPGILAGLDVRGDTDMAAQVLRATDRG